MKPLIQFSMKRITSINIPVSVSAINFQRLPPPPKLEATLKLQYFDIKVALGLRNICTYRKLCCWPNSTTKDNNKDSDDEGHLNRVPTGYADGNYNFRAECNEQEQLLLDKLQLEINKAGQMTSQDWDSIKSSVLKMYGTINENNIDAVIMNKCANLNSLSLGKSFFKYLKSTKKLINRATYGNYLRLYYRCKDDCTGDDLNEIILLYKELLKVYPVLDSSTAEKAISALSITNEWKEYEKLFVTIKRFYHPTVFTYKLVILAAFDHEEFERGWRLIEEMQYQDLKVPDEIFFHWFQKVKCRMLEEDFFRVLNFLNFFNIKPSDQLCNGMQDAFEMYNKKGKVTYTRITRTGECRVCHSKLEPCYVSQEDFDELKKEFLNPVIVGKDIFQKTKPEEFKEFLTFLEKSGPFDVVLDGLNIALHGNKEHSLDSRTHRLQSVVKHFQLVGKRNILVLGRKHMALWMKSPQMEYVSKTAHMFLTENISQDDPFMLYAALHSGRGTCFVSSDLMRSHKFLLSANPKLQTTFFKWQSTHQYFIKGIWRNGRVNLSEPVEFLQTIQQNSKGDWHIPFVVTGEELTNLDKVDHLHKHWLCFQKNYTGETRKPSVAREPSVRREKALYMDNPVKKLKGKVDLKSILKMDE